MYFMVNYIIEYEGYPSRDLDERLYGAALNLLRATNFELQATVNRVDAALERMAARDIDKTDDCSTVLSVFSNG